MTRITYRADRFLRLFCGSCFAVVFLLCLSSSLFAQTNPSDSLATKKSAATAKVKHPGYDLPDSLYRAIDSAKGSIDTIVYYTAKDSAVFDVPNKNVMLTGDATLDYQQRDLKAHRIVLDFPTSNLKAMSSTYDSAITSSVAHQRRIIRDTARIKSRGAPKLMDGSTPYEGELISYNLNTKQGTVQLGTTAMQGGYYYGEKIKQVDQGVLFVKNGRYTTCDAATPHFYFESPKMKVLSGDQVFAEPVYLFIADVPVFALPFAVFPEHETGRHTGLIVPNYTTQNSRGFGLTHLGYYVVFSDYYDAAFRSDIYTKGGYNLELAMAYMKRYLLSSPINLTLDYGHARFSSGDPFTETYRLNFAVPNLLIDPVTSFNSNVSFQSQNYQNFNARNINDLLAQSINSNASFNTQFEKLGVSFGASYSRSQNLITGEYQETSPSVSISRTSPIYLFGNQENESTSGFLQSVALNYGLSISRNVSKTRTINAPDSAHNLLGDTSFATKEQFGILHSPSISITEKAGYISLTPSVSYREAWFLREKTKTAYLDTVRNVNGKLDTLGIGFNSSYNNGFYRANSYDFGLSAATTLYGVANIGAFGVKAIRHAIQPSISLNYHPDVSSQEKRYYTDPRTNTQVAYSRFEDDGNSGISLGDRSGTVSFSLANDFEAKTEHKVNADSTTEQKVKLLNLSFGTGYDLIQGRWSPLSASANTQIGSLFSLGGNASLSFYPRNYTGGDSLDHTLLSLREGFLRFTNASFHIGGGFSSSETTEGGNVDSLKRLFRLNTPDEERQMFLGGNYPGQFVSVPWRPKWSISYDVSYTLGYSGPTVNKNLSASASFSMSPTVNWSFQTSAAYDLVSGQIVVPNLRIHRDLHCWELNFDYRPSGIIRGFNFEIRLKAPQLQDIKLTRQESTYGTF